MKLHIDFILHSMFEVSWSPRYRQGSAIPEDSIFFAVKTWSGFHRTRAKVVKKTWGRHVKNLVFFSDTDGELKSLQREDLDFSFLVERIFYLLSCPDKRYNILSTSTSDSIKLYYVFPPRSASTSSQYRYTEQQDRSLYQNSDHTATSIKES